MATITLTALTLAQVPSANQRVNVKYRLASAPDLAVSYTNVGDFYVRLNGNFITPVIIAGLAFGVSYLVLVSNECANSIFEKTFGIFGNVLKTGTATKNNCTGTGVGSSVTYSVAANTYTSTVSQAAADALAQADVDANKQAWANSHGICTWSSVAKSGTAAKNDCASGYPGNTVTYNVTAGAYTSNVSQAAADALAQADVDANKQAYANGGASLCPGVVNWDVREQGMPYADANWQIHVNGVVTRTVNFTDTGSMPVPAGATVVFEAFGEIASGGDNPQLHMNITKNSAPFFDDTEPDDAPPVVSIASSSFVMGAGDVYNVLVESTADVPAAPTPCGIAASYTGGASFPTKVIVDLGTGTGVVTLTFDMISIPDKAQVFVGSTKVIDTGYRGSSSYQTDLNAALEARGLPDELITGPGMGTEIFNKTTTDRYAVVYIWAPLPATAWSFTLGCPE